MKIMEKVKTFLLKNSASLLALVALYVGVGSVGKACILFFNQPEMPEEIRKYKR